MAILPAGYAYRRILAPLFGLGTKHFSKISRVVDAKAGDPLVVLPRSLQAMLELTPEQADRLARIEALEQPNDQDEFIDLLRKHGPFVFGLVRDGSIDNERGVSLLRVGMSKFVRMKRDFLAGVFDHWLAPPLSQQESLAWQKFVHTRAGDQRPGQADSDFIRELRGRFHIPISEGLARDALYGLPEPRAAGLNSKVYVLQSLAEQARLNSIRQARKPIDGWNARQDQIRHLLSEHGAFVFELVLARKLNLKDAAKLFGIPANRARELHALYREDDLHLALVKLSRPEEIERSKLFDRELKARGAENGLTELLHDIRRRLRIYIPERVATAKMHWLKQRGKRPCVILRGTSGRRKKVPLTDEQRRRVKALARTKWDAADDVDALRRDVLAEDGAFLMKMVDLGKVDVEEGARLTNLHVAVFERVQSDWRAGLQARHIEPPPTGPELDRQLRIVHEELQRAPAGERPESFIRRVGLLGVLLPRNKIVHLRERHLRKLTT
jgi:hypothetical protein